MELLPIVEAENAADALLKEAADRKERMIKEALAEREAVLTSVKPLPVLSPALRPLQPDLDALRERAAKNRRKAIAMILEEL